MNSPQTIRVARFLTAVLALVCLGLLAGTAEAQTGLVQPIGPPPPPPSKPATVRKLGSGLLALGDVRVDTSRREVSVPGHLNQVMTLEFVATKKAGAKSYESAMELDTDAITFNAALLLIGLDPSRARVSPRQFDPTPPQGDPVDVTVTAVGPDGKERRFAVEELLYDQRTKKTLPAGPWVYSGSTFVKWQDGTQRYLAELDGVLVGMMHGPSALIDNPRADAVGGFGAIILNPNLGLSPGATITLTVRALPRDGSPAAKR